MIAKLIVGYRTRTVDPEVLATITPVIEANKRLTDKDKIAADIAERTAAFQAKCKNWAYTGTFDEVVITDPKSERAQRWEYRPPGGKKPPICVAVANWILKQYPNAWANDTHSESRTPEVIFVGFNPRRFLKMLGLECSLPANNKPLPIKMWYGNSDHRDIEEAILPSDFKDVSLASALKCRRPVEAKAAAIWDKSLVAWQEPHVDPLTDVWLATELATQLGFLTD